MKQKLNFVGILSFILLAAISTRKGNTQPIKTVDKNAQQTCQMTESTKEPGKYQILSENGRITIPFEFYRNKFRFKAVINGRVCNLMLDNGSLWDQLLFFGSPNVDSLGFKITGETSLGNATADVASNITIGFEDAVFHNQLAVVTRYDPNLPNLWEGFEGQISATFFKHFVVRLDFDKSVIELIPPDRFTYDGTGQTFIMHPGPFDSRTIKAEISVQGEAAVKLELLVDLGGLHPLYLPIGRDERITLPSDAVEASLGQGLFSQKGYLGTVKSIRVGDYLLHNVPTAFTIVDKNSNVYGNTMIGLPLLKRFNIIFDYFNGRIILEPSASFNDAFQAGKQ